MTLLCCRLARRVRAALIVRVRVPFHPARDHLTLHRRRTRRTHRTAVIKKEVVGAAGAVDVGAGRLARIPHRLMTQILHHHREIIAGIEEEIRYDVSLVTDLPLRHPCPMDRGTEKARGQSNLS